ncbi:MAG: ABC transporter ATP-binding protein, partial [Cellulomonadaceae bacterium]|nr:ABC transporter ATP-binding protein [Cellulomonadaceae bacterium]
FANRVAVMYAGRIVEVGTVREIFYNPRHPYSWGLLGSLPSADNGDPKRLTTIPGAPPSMLNPPKGDAFAPRNPYALAIDGEQAPPFFQLSDTHYAATWLLAKGAPKVTPPKDIQQRWEYWAQ